MSNKLNKVESKKKSTYIPNTNSKNYLLIPLVLLIIIVPLFVRLYLYDSNLNQFAWFVSSESEADVFLYYKGIFLTIIAVFMAFILLIKLMLGTMPKLKKEYWLYFLLGYGVLTFISTIASEYRYFGFNGMYEQFETIWVILSYCIVTFYTFVIVRTEKDIEIIKSSLFVLLTIICAIGISQFIGKDFFESELGKKLIIPDEFAELRENMSFSFSSSGTHQVYLTLYNPNYVGVFTALLLPITLILIPASKKIIKKVLWAVISVLLLVCAFGSGSKAFLIALIVLSIAAVIICRKYLFKYYIPFLITTCAFIITVRGAFAYIGINPVDYVKNALAINKNEYLLQDVRTVEDGVTVTYNNATVKVSYSNIADVYCFLEFKDENGNPLEAESINDSAFKLLDERFDGLTFTHYAGFDNYDFFISIICNGYEMFFTNIENQGYQYFSSALKPDEIVKARSAIFTEYDRLASGRGFIWSKTIPLLKDNFFLGSGADTFTIEFPHNDYVARLNSGYYNTIITKPHNLYLQIGVQHGVLALICFLVICAWYILQSIKLYWKMDMSNKNHLFGVGLMLSVLGYLILGITNDSVVAIAPLFWMIIGLGFAVNKINRNTEASC